MLSQDHITPEQQVTWFQRIHYATDQQHFMIQYKGVSVGVVNIKALGNELLFGASVIEIGLYIYEEKYRGNFLAFCPALAISDYCFDYLACDQLYAKVIANNNAAIRFNEALGYKAILASPNGLETKEVESKHDNELFIDMHLSQADYEACSVKLKKFIQR